MSDESTHEHLEQDPELAASEGVGEELDDEQLEAVAGGERPSETVSFNFGKIKWEAGS